MQSGQHIGQYQIIELLGQGGMATVYKAYHTRLNRHIALKIIHRSLLEDRTFIARFEREAQIVAQLEHPNIVPIHDYAEFEGQPYIVMKLIEGCSLKDALKQGALELSDILTVIQPIANALDYAHTQGVLHRDVKPSNIMLDTRGTPYLTDFGLARLVEAGETTLSRDMLLGTPYYLSPEQGLGDRVIDRRSDVYSLGVVLYEMLVGKVPFTGSTPMSVVHNHIYSPLPLPSAIHPELPAAVEAVVLKALAKAPEDRYESAGEMVEALRDALADVPPAPHNGRQAQSLMNSVAQARANKPPAVALPAPQEHSQPQPRKRRKIPILAVGALALVTLVIVALLALNLMRLRRLAAASTVELYTVPELSIEQAGTAVASSPSDPVAYLALARAYLEADDREAAAQALADGARYTNDPVRYWLSVGSAALNNERVDFAFVAYREALLRAESDESYPQVRAFVGERLYNAVLVPGALDAVNISRALAARAETPVPPLLDAMYARALVSNGRWQLAEEVLNRALEEAPDLAEGYLVRGDLFSARNARETALREWETARSTAGAPRWVQARATELIEAAS